MFQISILFLTLFVFSHHYPSAINAANTEWMPVNVVSPLADQDMREALLFSNVTVGIVEEYIQYKLPEEAKADGEVILVQFKDGIADCERLLHTVVNIWEYKQCGSALLRDAMAALAALQQNYRPYAAASSATRLKLLLW